MQGRFNWSGMSSRSVLSFLSGGLGGSRGHQSSSTPSHVYSRISWTQSYNRNVFVESTTSPLISWWATLRKELMTMNRFENHEVEMAFQRYVLQANMVHLIHLLGLLIATSFVLVLGLLYMLHNKPYAVTDETYHTPGPDNASVYLTIITIVVSIVAYVICLFGIYRRELSEEFLNNISYILISTFLIQEIALSRSTTYLWGTIFHVYITYALLPVRLLPAIISGVALSVVHVPAFHTSDIVPPSYYSTHYKEMVSNCIILLGINVVGILTNFPADMAKRKAFNETREYIRAKIVILKETERQQRLLLSVLPDHLTEEMKADLDLVGIERKIYIKSYNPVSILFADICGFTAMADREPAQKVVSLLNDLYCRFDRLARRNKCLRIKLLGDCYYCVAGLPKRTALHADYAVNMALDMVTTMGLVRESFSADVEMRVGIHSGKVYCGVLGLRKWQFDVWSRDVTLANLMESSGKPGMVHISAVTKAMLTDEYEFQPGNGHERDPALMGVETFFVTKRLSASRLRQVSVKEIMREEPETYKENEKSNLLFGRTLNEKQLEKEVLNVMHTSISSRGIRKMRDKSCRSYLLKFRQKELEKKYIKEPDTMIRSYFCAGLLNYTFTSIVQFVVMPKTALLFSCSLAGFGYVLVTVYLVMANRYNLGPKIFIELSEKISRNRTLAQALAILTIIVCYVAMFLPVVVYERGLHHAKVDKDFIARHRERIDRPEIIMFAVKIVVLSMICLAYIYLFGKAPHLIRDDILFKYCIMIITLISFVLLLGIHSQQSEIIHRLDFMWKMKARGEKEDIQRMQYKNQSLINNILPVHVAKLYLNNEQDVEELYHEQCESACILFACVTHFSFSDDGDANSINILHDIISDFDELLGSPKFSGIEKIKSTGPVYMAASGLTESVAGHHYKQQNEHIIKIGDLALKLKEQMFFINEKHLTNYGIQIGISMGPVVAGVIGASMPQYDIWGNTVNVASRMYSTGIENTIQMTEDVAQVMMNVGFKVKKRGAVFVKGKGDMPTYFLIGPREKEDRKSTTIQIRDSKSMPDVYEAK